MKFDLRHIARKSVKLRELYRRARFLGKAVRNNARNPKQAWLFACVLPHTMVSYEALSKTYELAQKVEEQKLEGAFVECGVWKGGAAGAMAYVVHKAGSSRAIWLFDSFEGLPEPSEKDGTRAKEYAGGKNSGTLVSIGKCVGPLEDVRRLFFSKLKLSGANVHIEQGWFQDTLPKVKEGIGPIALLRMDADWYESTREILRYLFDNVVPGGYVIIDDYQCWEGCRKAVDEFFAERNKQPFLVRIDRESVYFQK